MIEKIMKTVKRGNKKRSRNITIGAVIGFLLSCTAVAGADEVGLDIAVSGSVIKFNGEEYDREAHEFSENTFDGQTYTNNTEISKTSNTSDAAYGIKINLNGIATPVEIINNGAISAESTSSNAYGIDNVANSKISLINNGTISASNGGTYSYGITNSGTIEKLDNSGIVGTNAGTLSYVITNSGTINKLNNNGILFSSSSMASGIHNNGGEIKNLDNSGMLFGKSGWADVGIYNESGTIGIINNFGISTGLASAANLYGIWNGKNGVIEIINNSGIFIGRGSDSYGIRNVEGTIGANTEKGINNMGVIYGNANAIYNDSGTISTVNNYGILVNGKDQPVNSGVNPNNYGLIIQNGSTITRFKNPENIEISLYDEALKREMKIKNASLVDGQSIPDRDDIEIGSKGTESFELKDGTNDYNNSILNGKDKTLEVTASNAEVTGSIINAYGTAVVFGDAGNNNQLTLSGTIVNGGIDGSAAILGNDNITNGDNLILQSGTVQYIDGSKGIQNTIVNGNIDMGKGNDTLTIGDGTIVNGTIDGGEGTDTLNFGVSGSKSNSSESEGVRILHNITGFENMNINTNVTLFEKTIDSNGAIGNLEVTGVENIKIGEDGNLILRIDGTNNNSHALSKNNGGTINSEGGKLLLGLNGVSDNSEIDIKMNLGDSMYGIENKDIIYGDKFTLDTTSALHSVEKINNTTVKVTTKSQLPVSPVATVNYDELDKIYQSMRDVDGVKEFNVDTNKKLSAFVGYLNDIYAGNPYSYSSELSRKSVGMFRDIAVESQFKPELNKWLIMGGLTHVDGGTKDTYYGKGYYTYDIGSIDMETQILK